jgi:hypothetical protein
MLFGVLAELIGKPCTWAKGVVTTSSPSLLLCSSTRPIQWRHHRFSASGSPRYSSARLEVGEDRLHPSAAASRLSRARIMFYVQASTPPPSSPPAARSHHLLLRLPFSYSFFLHTENAPKMKQTELANFSGEICHLPSTKIKSSPPTAHSPPNLHPQPLATCFHDPYQRVLNFHPPLIPGARASSLSTISTLWHGEPIETLSSQL